MMEIIAQAVRVIDYENNSVQRRNVNMMPKFKDYIEQLIVHVSNNVSIREYHTQSTRTEVIAGILEIAGNLETPDAIEEKIDSIACEGTPGRDQGFHGRFRSFRSTRTS